MKATLGFVMVFALAASGCGGGKNECEEAADKIKQCNVPNFYGKPPEGQCSDQTECVGKCINDSSCADIESDDENSKFSVCFNKCFGL